MNGAAGVVVSPHFPHYIGRVVAHRRGYDEKSWLGLSAEGARSQMLISFPPPPSPAGDDGTFRAGVGEAGRWSRSIEATVWNILLSESARSWEFKAPRHKEAFISMIMTK